MLNFLQTLPPLILLILATTLEVSGDAIVRVGLHGSGYGRIGVLLAGAALLFGYGTFLNLAPIEFGKVVGLYIATLFVVWQVISFLAFRQIPTLPVIVGGSFIVVGGAIVTFWKPA